jgi:hypothetical protein
MFKMAMLCVALFSFASPAVAHLGCQSPESAKKSMESFDPNALVIDAIIGKRLVTFMSAFNNVPPVSYIKSDRVVVWGKEDMPDVMLAFFREGCYEGAVAIKKIIYYQLMQTAPKQEL